MKVHLDGVDPFLLRAAPDQLFDESLRGAPEECLARSKIAHGSGERYASHPLRFRLDVATNRTFIQRFGKPVLRQA